MASKEDPVMALLAQADNMRSSLHEKKQTSLTEYQQGIMERAGEHAMETEARNRLRKLAIGLEYEAAQLAGECYTQTEMNFRQLLRVPLSDEAKARQEVNLAAILTQATISTLAIQKEGSEQVLRVMNKSLKPRAKPAPAPQTSVVNTTRRESVGFRDALRGYKEVDVSEVRRRG